MIARGRLPASKQFLAHASTHFCDVKSARSRIAIRNKVPLFGCRWALIMRAEESELLFVSALKRVRVVLSARPRVTELAFQLFGRALHPELFYVYQTREVERGGYSAKIQITSAGHLITWRYQGLTLTEVAASAQHPLPQRRRLMSYKLKGERNDRVECRGGVRYQCSFQLEPVTPDIFWMFQQELTLDSERKGLLHTFDASGRMALGALSYINVETRNRSLLVQAFHTFPDDYAIVKSQSLFELPK